jgi:cell division protein FtsI (penicillin-binding protein 3)
MVPADDPLFVIILVFWKPNEKYYGGEVAAPVFRAIAERALSYEFVPRDDDVRKNVLVLHRNNEPQLKSQSF